MKLFNKIRRLFFDYEEFGPETGHTLTKIPKRDGDYLFSVKTPNKNYYLLYKFSNKRDYRKYEKFITCSKLISDTVVSNFKYYNESPVYKFYRIKNKYCVVNAKYGEDEDVWLSSATRLGMSLLLLSVFLSGSAILIVLYYILKFLIVSLFM